MKDFIEGISLVTTLQLYLQIAIPVGYLGYLISRLGISRDDSTPTVIFTSLCFAFVSALTWYICGTFYAAIQIGLSILIPILVAISWRKCLHEIVMKVFHYLRIGNTTHLPDVRSDIIQNTSLGMSQVTVYLKDGTALSCDYLYDFEDAPLSLCRWDRDGIALYVTQEKSASGSFEAVQDEPKMTVDGTELYRLTFVPNDEIGRIEFVTNKIKRKKLFKNPFSAGVGEPLV